MSRDQDTRPSSAATHESRFHPLSFAGVVALLFLALAAPPLAAQPSLGPTTGVRDASGQAPSVEGFVTAVDGTIVTLLGSPLLRIDISGATILAADAPGGTPPPITPGAYILATWSLCALRRPAPCRRR